MTEKETTNAKPKYIVEVCAALLLLCIALPLNVGVAIASGMSAELGIVSGVVSSLVTGVLSSSPTLISGPDAGIGVLVLESIQKFGIQSIGPIVLIAGCIQLILGFASGAKWFKVLSPAVVNGMLVGMGLLIIFTQFHIMLDDKPKDTGLLNMLLMPETLIKGVMPAANTSHQAAGILALCTIAIACLWSSFAPKALKQIPNALIAIGSVTLYAVVAKLDVNLVNIPATAMQNIALITPSKFFAAVVQPDILLAAAMLAFVCSAQSLVTLTAVDEQAARFNSAHDKELIAQGIGNIVCGALGAMPIVGALLRSMATKQTGAVTKIPNVLHGILMVAAIFFAPKLLQMIPTSVLAAMLVLIGYRMVSGIIGNVKGYETGEMSIFAITACAIVCTNLATGVIIGFVAAAIKAFYTLGHLSIRVSQHENHVTLRLRGAATFLSLPKLAETFEQVPDGSVVHLTLDDVSYIDHACFQAFQQWEKQHRGQLFIDWDSAPLDQPLKNALPERSRVVSFRDRYPKQEPKVV